MAEYPVERILGLFIYCFVIFTFFILIRQSSGYRQLKKWLRIYVLVLTILAFLYIPSRGADVSRLMVIGDSLGDSSWPEFFNWTFKSTSTPISMAYLRLVQSLNISGALSGISTLIAFSLMFSSVYTVTTKLNISNQSASYYILFLMCGGTYFGVIAGIRFALATAIVVHGMISAWYGRRHYLLLFISMIISCLIHTGMVPIVAFWLLTLFLGRELFRRIWLKVVVIVIGVIAVGVLNSYIMSVFNKFEIYYGTGASFGNKSYIISLISFVIYVGLIISSKKYGFLGSLNGSNKWMLIILTLFELYIIRDFVLFARYQYVYPLLLMPYLLSYAEKSNEEYTRKYLNTIMILSLLRLALGYLGDMSGMKFFVL